MTRYLLSKETLDHSYNNRGRVYKRKVLEFTNQINNIIIESLSSEELGINTDLIKAQHYNSNFYKRNLDIQDPIYYGHPSFYKDGEILPEVEARSWGNREDIPTITRSIKSKTSKEIDWTLSLYKSYLINKFAVKLEGMRSITTCVPQQLKIIEIATALQENEVLIKIWDEFYNYLSILEKLNTVTDKEVRNMAPKEKAESYPNIDEIYKVKDTFDVRIEYKKSSPYRRSNKIDRVLTDNEFTKLNKRWIEGNLLSSSSNLVNNVNRMYTSLFYDKDYVMAGYYQTSLKVTKITKRNVWFYEVYKPLPAIEHSDVSQITTDNIIQAVYLIRNYKVKVLKGELPKLSSQQVIHYESIIRSLNMMRVFFTDADYSVTNKGNKTFIVYKVSKDEFIDKVINYNNIDTLYGDDNKTPLNLKDDFSFFKSNLLKLKVKNTYNNKEDKRWNIL